MRELSVPGAAATASLHGEGQTIVVLAGVVVGGMNRLLSATLGGFSIGFVAGLLGGALPTAQSQYLPSVLFGLVILVLLIRPSGLFARATVVERV